MTLLELAERVEKAEALVAALIVMAREGVPPDIQELLVHGCPDRNVPPGVLQKAFSAYAGLSDTLLSEFRAVIRAMEIVEFHAREPNLDLTNKTCRAILKDVLTALRARAAIKG